MGSVDIEERVGPAERVALGSVVLMILTVGAYAVLGPEQRLAYLFYDDAYYYLGVARNLASGAGSTFDGINPTNGYHPLWCWILTPLFFVAEEPGRGVRAAAIGWFIFACLAPLAVWWAVRPRTGGLGAIFAAAFFGLHPFLGLGLARPNGLETPLYALLIALFVGVFERTLSRPDGTPKTGGGFRLGLLLGLVILARLDALMLAMATAILLGLRMARREGMHAALTVTGALTLGSLLVAGPSLIWNTLKFGHPMPISGRVIAHYAAQERAELGGLSMSRQLRRRAFYAVRSVPPMLVRRAFQDTPASRLVPQNVDLRSAIGFFVGGGLLWAALAVRRRRGDLGSDALALLASFGLLHYTAYGGWLWTGGEEEYRLYYFMPEIMLLAIAAGTVSGYLVTRLIHNRIVQYGLTAVVLAMLSLHLLQQTSSRRQSLAASPGPLAERHIYGWIRKRLPVDAVLGARDAGKLGFFSGRPVVNLDGLANDQRFLKAMQQDREDVYILESPIRYVFSDRFWLYGFDPAHPERPPKTRAGTGEILYRLVQRPECTVTGVADPPDDWVVANVQCD